MTLKMSWPVYFRFQTCVLFSATISSQSQHCQPTGPGHPQSKSEVLPRCSLSVLVELDLWLNLVRIFSAACVLSCTSLLFMAACDM